MGLVSVLNTVYRIRTGAAESRDENKRKRLILRHVDHLLACPCLQDTLYQIDFTVVRRR
jgi:hypothetical protein